MMEGVSPHFSQRLNQRFGIYSDKMTRFKVLMAIVKKEAQYIRTEGNKVVFRMDALGADMIIVIGKNGVLITCDRVKNINEEKKYGRH